MVLIFVKQPIPYNLGSKMRRHIPWTAILKQSMHIHLGPKESMRRQISAPSCKGLFIFYPAYPAGVFCFGLWNISPGLTPGHETFWQSLWGAMEHLAYQENIGATKHSWKLMGPWNIFSVIHKKKIQSMLRTLKIGLFSSNSANSLRI